MNHERVTYSELNVAKGPRKLRGKPPSPTSVTEQEITYVEISFQSASQETQERGQDSRCTAGFPCPPEKLFAGTLGIICLALMTAVVLTATVFTPDIVIKEHIESSLTRTQKAYHCAHCPKGWLSYSSSCYYISVEPKPWNESSGSCTLKNAALLYIDNEDELEFLNFLSFASWTGIFRKSSNDPWVVQNDSTFRSKYCNGNTPHRGTKFCLNPCSLLCCSDAGKSIPKEVNLGSQFCGPSIDVTAGYGMTLLRFMEESREMRDCHNAKLKSTRRGASRGQQSQRCALRTRRHVENLPPPSPGRLIAVAMMVRFVVLAAVWTAIFLTSLLNQEVPLSSTEGYCGPCPKSWLCYRNNCYQFFNESKNWYQSQASCMSQNSSLLKIYSREDQDFLKLVKPYHWMGSVQIPANGSWQWEDGSILSPNLVTIMQMENDTCAVYGSNFKGYTENCLTPNTYICMKRIV